MRTLHSCLAGFLASAALAVSLEPYHTVATNALAASTTSDTTGSTGTGTGTGPGGGGGGGGGSGLDNHAVVVWTDSDFDEIENNPNASALTYKELDINSAKTFRFSFSPSEVTIVRASLLTLSDSNVIGEVIANAPSTQDEVNLTWDIPHPQGSNNTLATLNISGATTLIQGQYSGVPLYFQIDWTENDNSGSSGSTFSRRFAFFPSYPDAGMIASYTNTSPVRPETTSTGKGTATKAATATTATTAVATIRSTSSATATTEPGSVATAGSKSGGGGGGGGVSKGAIAGIVIGVVVAVAAVAAAIFLFIRRRKSSAYDKSYMAGPIEPYRGAGAVPDLGGDRSDGPGGSGSGVADNLMSEKVDGVDLAAPGAAGTNGGPHSPYTDDNANNFIPSRQGSAGPATAAAARTTAAVPTARPVSTGEGSFHAGTSPSASPTRAAAQPVATGPALPSTVAALVEDHMTPEDVARLEAEERELDAVIENAMRSRTAGGNQ